MKPSFFSSLFILAILGCKPSYDYYDQVTISNLHTIKWGIEKYNPKDVYNLRTLSDLECLLGYDPNKDDYSLESNGNLGLFKNGKLAFFLFDRVEDRNEVEIQIIDPRDHKSKSSKLLVLTIRVILESGAYKVHCKESWEPE